MTLLAALILLTWALGIIVGAAALPHLIRHDIRLTLAFEYQPVAVGLLLSAGVAFWPAALGAAVLSAAVGRPAR
ncbi:hypothetical protein [Kitasatospora sp. NPDC088548]|uniref:hypothetical protein n=1 Tax=Kitasatospora sp. NPDC088548 TaxID=3364075 RepID=UPI00382E143B